MKIILFVTILLMPLCCQAICLVNCQQEGATPSQALPSLKEIYITSPTNQQSKSFNTGNVKNSVFGNMNVRVGHKIVDIRTDSNSNHNNIDASINSTIILGDLNK